MEYSGILKTCGLVIIALVALTVMKQLRSDFVLPTRAVVYVVFASIIVASAVPVINYISKLSELYGVTKYYEILLKALSVTLTLKLTSDICTELGEPSIAAAVETICKLQLIIIAIPMIDSIVDKIIELL